ncbi:hypothetical protein AEAC466_19285 [Asticcacaulis sp. AC466]|uniref:hypothetical protein n=1 Tax=Asticcacaulis sp. AC466 TaxID=1282362 RepID=UPI0003C407D8|nr:hypothetical protein [Asticcacaulis sp. AC466]ESQ82064.1 hypothetical protein AEAC466_19285 [Asticcacaulis sp. AC466]
MLTKLIEHTAPADPARRFVASAYTVFDRWFEVAAGETRDAAEAGLRAWLSARGDPSAPMPNEVPTAPSPDFTRDMTRRAIDRLNDAERYLKDGDADTAGECLQSARDWLAALLPHAAVAA